MFRPVLRRATAVVGTAAIGAGLALGVPSATASAAPITSATFSADATARNVDLSAGLLPTALPIGSPLLAAQVGEAVASAGAQPLTSTASGTNLRATALGAITIPIVTNTRTAPPTASNQQDFLPITIPGLARTGAITSDVTATAPTTAGTCLAPGAAMSTSTTETAAATVLPGLVPGVNLADVSAVRSTTTTSLVSAAGGQDTRAVRSTADTRVAGVSVLGANGLRVTVDGNPTLTATASGTPATSGATLSGVSTETVRVTLGGAPVTLDPSGVTTIPVNLSSPGPLSSGLRATVKLSLGQVTGLTNTGTNVAATATVVKLEVDATLFALGIPTPLAKVTLGVGQLEAKATAPSGGVQCSAVPAAPAPVIDTPTNPTTTNDSTPTIGGTGQDGATVVISDGNTPICTTTVSGGRFSCTPGTALGDGPHVITAVQTPPGGSPSAPSNAVTITVDTVAPAAPIIVTPLQGSTTFDTTPDVTGTAEPGSTVRVFVDGGATPVCSLTASPIGTFTCTTPVLTASPAGTTHTATATATDGVGNTSPVSATRTFTVVTVPVPVPGAPLITAPAGGSTVNTTTPEISGTRAPGAAVTVTRLPGTTPVCTVAAGGTSTTFSCTPTAALPQGTVTISATQTVGGITSAASNPVTFSVDSVAPVAPVLTYPAPGTTVVTNDNTPTVTGNAPGENGSTANVRIDGTTVCTTVVAGGTFSCTLSTVTDGTKVVTATITDAAGNTGPASGSGTLQVDTTPPGPPVISTPANGSLTNDNTPAVTGTGEVGATVTVTGTGSTGGPKTCTATVGADGRYSCDLAVLPEGSITIVATQKDAAGNTSGPSTSTTITVDTTRPAAPTITAPPDGGVVKAGLVTFTGRGEAGALLVVSENGLELCRTFVRADGSYSCTTAGALAVTSHTVTATQTDLAGNTSPPSDPVRFTIQLGGTQFVGTGPTRVLETRPQFGGSGGPIGAAATRTISARDLGLPAGTASAVVLNLTVDNPAAAGIITAFPTGGSVPNVSALNYTANQTVANLAVVPVGADGGVVIYSSQRTDVVVDLFGYFSTTELSPDSGLYHPLTPARIGDSRLPGGGGALGAGETRPVKVTGVGNVPATGVSSVTLNVTVDRPSARGFVAAFPTGTVFPAGQSYPATSNVNFYPGDIRSSRVVVPVGADGQVSFYNLAGSTSLVVDVVGWFSASGSNDTTGSQFVAVAPTRDLDTRSNLAGEGRFGPAEERAVDVTDAARIPKAGLTAVVTNVTGVQPSLDGFLRVYPPGPLPGTSDVNFRAGQVVPNLTFAGVDSTGRTTIRNEFGQTDVVVDVTGYFTPTPPAVGVR